MYIYDKSICTNKIGIAWDVIVYGHCSYNLFTIFFSQNMVTGATKQRCLEVLKYEQFLLWEKMPFV